MHAKRKTQMKIQKETLKKDRKIVKKIKQYKEKYLKGAERKQWKQRTRRNTLRKTGVPERQKTKQIEYLKL